MPGPHLSSVEDAGERAMAQVIAGMTMSVDGFVADETGSAGCLYPDLAALQGSEYMNGLIEATGAVIMGKRAFEMGDPDWHVGNYEFQVPIFVVTHEPPQIPPKQDQRLTFTFVPEGIESAVIQAKAAAGDQSVQVIGGASVIRQLLHTGLVDELHVDIVPMLLGAGIQLFDSDSPEVELEKIDVQEKSEREPA